jgi:hypothetical protein
LLASEVDMVNRINVPGSTGQSALLKQLPARSYALALGAVDTRRVIRIFSALPPLQYPINSAGELIEKLGGRDASLTIAGRTVRPGQIVGKLPAYYFPIASFENFAEKIAGAIRAKRSGAKASATTRSSVRIAASTRPRSTEIDALRAQLPPLQFPIRDADVLIDALKAGGPYRFRNRTIAPHTLKALLPANMFPIASMHEFLSRVSALIGESGGAAPAASTKHAPALANRVVFGLAKASGPAVHNTVAREAGHVAEPPPSEMQGEAGAPRQARLKPRRT